MTIFFPASVLILLFAAIFCFFWATMFPKRRGLVLICLLTLLVLVIINGDRGEVGTLRFDRLSNFGFSLVLIFQVFILGILKIFSKQTNKRKQFVYFFFITSTLGLYLVVHSYNLLAFLVGLELTLISLLFMGLSADKKITLEAGYRFLFHNLAGTMVLLLVLFYFYSHFESFHLAAQPVNLSSDNILPILLLFLAIAHKLGLGPFYFWHLDWLEAAPMPVTTAIATSYRIAVLFFTFRVLRIYVPQASTEWTIVVTGFSLFSLLIPLLHALAQNNFKRGFSSFLLAQLGLFFLPLALQPLKAQPPVLLVLLMSLICLIGLISLISLYNPGDRRRLHDIINPDTDPGGSQLAWAFLWLSLGFLPPTIGYVTKLIFASALITSPTIIYFLLFLPGYLLLLAYCMKTARNYPLALSTECETDLKVVAGKMFLKLSLITSLILTVSLMFLTKPIAYYIRHLLIE